MTESERMSISGLLDVLNTGISLSTCHIEYVIQINVLEDLIRCLEELEQYRAIGTIEEFKALKEKSVAKKAEWKFDDFTAKFGNPYHCSNCDEEFGDTYNYCPNCGCDMYAD